ncbi:MAG: arsenite methyltransferase [Dysgonamonadaceae bacterium]|nr:arsenite methyltransferase [Dysgonamonadaceae bacterium]
MEKLIIKVMAKEHKIKQMVKQKYGEIASLKKETSCCPSESCCSPDSQNSMSEDYSTLEGYVADADLNLGCGLPVQFAKIKKGDTVLDLGSGAGNDCFVARAEVGESGNVIGIDFTPTMVSKARENAEKRGFNNVEFREGDIDNMPVESISIDVVISNCVLNLLPSKEKIFHEIHRVLKSGGHFCISDVVLEKELPQSLKEVAELYTGCISGANTREQYLSEISNAGFQQIEIVKTKEITLPDEFLSKYFENNSINKNEKTNKPGIFSITVTGQKV